MSSYLQPVDQLSPGGNLESYIQSVNSIPLLSVEDEQALSHKLYYDGDLDAARRLVMSHLRFVVYIARSYAGYGLSEADLIQEGNVGLMKAVKRFNPEYGVRLVSFAVHWIKAEIHEYILKNWRIVKIATTKAQRKLFFNLRSTRKGIGWMDDHEVDFIAGELGVKPRDVRQMEGRLASRDESFDGPPESDDDDFVNPSRVLSDPAGDPADLVAAARQSSDEREQLAAAFEQLDERAREIVRSRWLTEDKATLHTLADRFGISAERVRQLEQNALKKLRKQITA